MTAFSMPHAPTFEQRKTADLTLAGSTVEKALQLAQVGLPVFPCRPDKRPVPRNGFHAASTDPEQITLWRWDDGRLIGVPTGEVSGIDVLDYDGPRHSPAKAWFVEFCRRGPATRAHQTCSGGTHLLFRHRDGLRSWTNQPIRGIDGRADGGYIVWWPAHNCRLIDDIPLADLPDWPPWFVPQPQGERARHWQPGQRGQPRTGDPVQVARLVQFVGESPVGERNSRLYWAACRLAEMRFERAQHGDNAATRLLQTAVAVGLEAAEAERTILSGLSQGQEGAP